MKGYREEEESKKVAQGQPKGYAALTELAVVKAG